MTGSHIDSSLDSFLGACLQRAIDLTGRREDARVVVSPYRFNPLGAHIDHQGGAVLARCLDQYTILVFWPRNDSRCVVHASLTQSGDFQCSEFGAHELDDKYGWDSMARAALTAMAGECTISNGMEAVVFGTLVSGGLSSSASVTLAYLSALAYTNDIELSDTQLVELVRRVENDFRGLNNGVQDQMSIVFGQQDHLVRLDVEQITARGYPDPCNAGDVVFLMCYSGVSRDLVTGSNFNQRVSECREAAKRLSPGARHLGSVPEHLRTDSAIAHLPEVLQRRARHVYEEMQRVERGCVAWVAADWSGFGQLMNDSCYSSIHYYESGSKWLIHLHDIANTLEGVYGSRFSGGGYGGCLFLLADANRADDIAGDLLAQYLHRYPELSSLARASVARSEGSVRIVSA